MATARDIPGWENLDKLIADGYIRQQWHPSGDLRILNYTTKTAIERCWNEMTLTCRGLIVTKDDKIHARSFRKFFSLGEAPGPSIDQLPAEIPVITRKLDGYLGVAYWHDGIVKIASRGSFSSEYALWATDWFRSNIAPDVLRKLAKEMRPRYDWTDQTMVFEILHPKRIVVDNSDKLGLVLTAIIDNETGKEDISDYSELLNKIGIKCVHRFDGMGIEECEASNAATPGTVAEGFILYYPQADLRVKIKGEDYCKIHRIATKLTRRRVYELMGRPQQRFPESLTAAVQRVYEIRQALPDEYGKWMAKTATELWFEYSDGVDFYRVEAARPSNTVFGESRRDLVARLQRRYPNDWGDVLAMIDGKEDQVRQRVWHRIYPAHEPALLQDGEDE